VASLVEDIASDMTATDVTHMADTDVQTATDMTPTDVTELNSGTTRLTTATNGGRITAAADNYYF